MDVVAQAGRHPQVGETVMGSSVKLMPGGKAANQAVAARRAGAATQLVARVGADVFGAQILGFLAAEGIDLQQTRVVPEASTGIALIVVAESNNSIVVVSGASAELDIAAVDAIQVGRGDVVVAQLESPPAAASAAFERARAAGALTILNPAPALRDAACLLASSDVVVLNETELAVFAGVDDVSALADPGHALTAATELRRHPGQTVIVTLGVAGAVAVTPEGPLRVAGRRVAVADTTGAGDCLVGNLAAGLCRGLPLAESLATANLAASLSVQALGAAISMPTAEALAAAGGQAGGGPDDAAG